jgi:hypothetical protein
MPMMVFKNYHDLRRVLVGEVSAITTVVYAGYPRRQYFVRAARNRVVPGYVGIAVSSLIPTALLQNQVRLDRLLDTLNRVTTGDFRVERGTHHEYNYYLVSSFSVEDAVRHRALGSIGRFVKEHLYYGGAAELLA